MKKILSILLILVCAVTQAQYNPRNGTLTNKPLGIAQAVPTDARSYFYDAALFKFRPYQSPAEVLSYLNLAINRTGQFPIFVSSGTLSAGNFSGGTITEYWFKDGTADADLVIKTGSGGGGTYSAGWGLTLTGTVFKADSNLLATKYYVNNQGFLTSLIGIVAGGDLSGTYPNPTVAQFNGLLPAYYLDRTNHTGTQLTSTLSDFPSQSGNGGKVLGTNGTAMSWVASAGVSSIVFAGNDSIHSLVLTKTDGGTLTASFFDRGGGGGGGGGGAPLLATYIVQNTSNAPTNAQVLATLATGILKNTVTTGVLSIAVASDFPTLNQNTTGTASNITGVLNAASFPALTGDVTTTAGSLVTTIAANAVTLSKFQQIATNSLIGRSTAATGNTEVITVGSGLSLSAGTLSATGAGGTVTSVSVVNANGFAGTVANPTTTPAITLSSPVTGIHKGNGTAILTAVSGTDYSAGTASLATGILKSTVTTGALSIAVAADFPTLNQNTTGNAATVTTNANLTGDVTSVGNATTLATVNSNVGTWNSVTVNAKGLVVAASNIATESPLTFSSPLSRTVNTISIPAATTSVSGYLTSTDWNTFNNKAAAGSVVTSITGTANQVITSASTGAVTLSLPQSIATTSSPTFNSGTFTDGTQGLVIRPYTNAAGYGAIYPVGITPANLNYVFLAKDGTTIMNAATSAGQIIFAVAGNQLEQIIPTLHAFSIPIAGTTGSFSGSVTGVTEALTDVSTKYATTAFVKNQSYGSSVSGTIGYIPKFNTASSITNSTMQDDGNGTITLNQGGGGSTLAKISSNVIGGYSALNLVNTGLNGKSWTVFVGGNNVAGTAGLSETEGNFLIQEGSTTRIFVKKTTGEIGLGTSNPLFKLDVAGTGNFTSSVTGVTEALGDASTKFASTAFVKNQNYISTETDPTVSTTIKNIPVSTDVSVNKYLNWNGTAYVRKQVDYTEIANAPAVSWATSKQTHTAGATVTATNGVNFFIVNPATTLAALTITLAASPLDGEKIEIVFGGTIVSGTVVTTMTISPNTGQSVLQVISPASVEAGEALSYRYNSTNAKWYRIN